MCRLLILPSLFSYQTANTKSCLFDQTAWTVCYFCSTGTKLAPQGSLPPPALTLKCYAMCSSVALGAILKAQKGKCIASSRCDIIGTGLECKIDQLVVLATTDGSPLRHAGKANLDRSGRRFASIDTASTFTLMHLE